MSRAFPLALGVAIITASFPTVARAVTCGAPNCTANCPVAWIPGDDPASNCTIHASTADNQPADCNGYTITTDFTIEKGRTAWFRACPDSGGAIKTDMDDCPCEGYPPAADNARWLWYLNGEYVDSGETWSHAHSIIETYTVALYVDDEPACQCCNDNPKSLNEITVRVCGWTPGSAITGAIDYPNSNDEFLAGHRADSRSHKFEAHATDMDHYSCGDGSYDEADTLTFTWSGYGSFPNGNTGTSVDWVAPSSTGSGTVTCTVSDGRDVGDPRHDADHQLQITAKAIAPHVWKVEFVSNGMVKNQQYPGAGGAPHTWSCDSWDNSATQLTKPEYDESVSPTRNNPGFYSPGSAQVKISWKADDGQSHSLRASSQVQYRGKWDYSASPPIYFLKTGTVNYLPHDGFVTLESDEDLPAKVRWHDEFPFVWSYKTPGTAPLSVVTINETEHDWMARSYAAPLLASSECTPMRVEEVSKATDGKDTVDDIAEAVVIWVHGNVSSCDQGLSPLLTEDLWCHFDNGAACIQCDEQAHLASLVLALLGVQSGAYKAYASTDCSFFNPETREVGWPFSHQERLRIHFGGGVWQDFEGFLQVPDATKEYYIVFGPGDDPYGNFASLLEMMESISEDYEEEHTEGWFREENGEPVYVEKAKLPGSCP